MYNNCDARIGNSFCDQPKGHSGPHALMGTMKAETHTPGPWRVWEKDDVMVAKVYGPPRTDGSDYAPLFETTNKANARLIAASPDLLEACQKAAAYCAWRAKEFDEEEARDTFTVLVEAIAKAGGDK